MIYDWFEIANEGLGIHSNTMLDTFGLLLNVDNMLDFGALTYCRNTLNMPEMIPPHFWKICSQVWGSRRLICLNLCVPTSLKTWILRFCNLEVWSFGVLRFEGLDILKLCKSPHLEFWNLEMLKLWESKEKCKGKARQNMKMRLTILGSLEYGTNVFLKAWNDFLVLLDTYDIWSNKSWIDRVLMVTGSWLMARGSWFMPQGSAGGVKCFLQLVFSCMGAAETKPPTQRISWFVFTELIFVSRNYLLAIFQ